MTLPLYIDGNNLIGVYFGYDETLIGEIDDPGVSEENEHCHYDYLSGRITDKAIQYLASIVIDE